MEFSHIPVMPDECINGLDIKEDGIYVDGTLGGAGHSRLIAERLGPEGMLIGIDRDEDAINASSERLKGYECRVELVKDEFRNIKKILKDLDVQEIDGALLDLGVSSFQLDEPERGFSYMQDAPLDMRMDRQNGFSAYDVVNGYEEKELARIIKDYGEERWAARIASFIANARKEKPIETTGELVSEIKKAIPAAARRDGPHPAKRTFQAIRIEVNDELDSLAGALEDFVDVLAAGGRLCVITFHSLEDRIAKETFNRRLNPCTCPPEFPVCVCGKKPDIKKITKKPLRPTDEELERNPRSRSAKVRVIEKK